MMRHCCRGTVALIALIFSVAAPTVTAHPGHGHAGDGRIPGQADLERIGEAEVRFHPKAREYTYKRGPNAPPMWFHPDSISAGEGAGVALPTTEEPVLCTGSGHRIRVMYASAATATPSPLHAGQIRTVVRQMASKILSESMRSSANTRGLRMAVECEANGDIRIQGFKSSGDVDEAFDAVDNLFGEPSGANAVKNLVFYAGSDPSGKAAGYGLRYDDDDKSSSDTDFFGGNFNRILSTSAIVYAPYWGYQVSLHELFHTFGAAQGGAPYATTGGHCWDGIDVLCYDDGTLLGDLYQETRCPASGGFETPLGVPLDCEYDTYFDSLETVGGYLKSHWNSGGSENPFLVQAPATQPPTVDTTSASGVTKTSALLNGTVNPNGLHTQYRFEYGLTTPYGTNVPVPDGTLGSNLYKAQTVGHTAGGLLPNTTYHYRLRASSAYGTSFGAEQTFTTPVSWTIQTTPNASGAEHSYLNDMSCEPASTTACTAVGKQTASGGASSPYAQYWNGTSWTNQTTASPAGATAAELQADHCVSKTLCVAAGSYSTTSGTFSLVEAWNGVSWSIQSTPNPAGATETRLNGVSCKEITACMAVGYSGSGSSSQPVAIRGNSGTWSLQTVPLPAGAVAAELTGVECTATTSCRAVGRYYPTSSSTTYWAMVSTWNGTTWASEAVPKPTGSPKRSTLLDVSCASGSSCTAVGGYMNASGVQVSYVERWNGTAWSWQVSPNPVGSTNTPLQNVSCVESSPCAVVGDWLDSSGVWRPMAQFWDGSAWVIESVAAPAGQTFGVLNGVACRSRCLATGWYTAGGKDKTLGEIR